MESSKRILQWRGFIFVAAAFVYFFVGLCVGELLVNFHLFLVTIVLFHSPLSSTNKVGKSCYADSSGKKRSRRFTDYGDHCVVLGCVLQGWAGATVLQSETAIFLHPPAPLPAMALIHCTQQELLLIWYSQTSCGCYLRFSFTPMKRMDLSTHFSYTIK